MSFNPSFKISKRGVQRDILTDSDTKMSSETMSLSRYADNISSKAKLDLGLMPEGIRLFRQNLGYAQVVVELPPGVNRNIWGEEEGDPDAEHFMLAQPYRILIIDFQDDNFLGARIFYSTTPIYDLDIPLYNANLSNVNCFGYSGNAVGWLCLYNNEELSNKPWEYKIRRMIERCSGEEVFNFANMHETDGIKLYYNLSDHEFLSNVSAWERKSDEEGFEWTLNDNIWIPVMVESEDSQGTNNFSDEFLDLFRNDELTRDIDDDMTIYKSESVQLTLRMALDGKYAATYGDKVEHKPTSANFNESSSSLYHRGAIYNVFNRGFIADAKAEAEDNPF